MVVGVGRGISGSVKSLGNITLSVGAVVKASWVRRWRGARLAASQVKLISACVSTRVYPMGTRRLL